MASYKEFRAHSEFDSRIIPSFASADPRYFGFVILLRIWLKQVNPPKGQNRFTTYNASNSPRVALRWDHGSWAHFKEKFLRVALGTWDQAFLLTPPASYNGFIWPEQGGKRRDLLCGLFIKFVDGERDNPHAVLNIVRLADPSLYFGADSTLLASSDVDGFTHGHRGAGVRWKQHPAAHEVGHLLGLHHVAHKSVACRNDFFKCYGSNLAERVNIMGVGDQLSLENAAPWRERIAWHTGIDQDLWKVDWASGAAMLRGTESYERIPNPALIDI
jgi:hypothetical protein